MMRYFLPVIACFLLIACGFRPLYSTGSTIGGNHTVLDSVIIEDIPTTTGLNIRNALIDRFYHKGYPQDAPYALIVAVRENYRSIVIERNDTATRSQLVLNADYQLIDRATRTRIDKGLIRAVSAYNILPSQYTTVVTMDDARDMAVRELADKITLRISMVLENAAPPNPNAKTKAQ